MTTNLEDTSEIGREHPALREWISLVDDDGETWLFDLSFFASNWQCIYGRGCAGIEEEPDVAGQRGCCSYGAHFADDEDLSRVMQIAAAIPNTVWENHSYRPAPSSSRAESLDALIEALTTVDDDGDRITRVVDGACVFLNSSRHPQGSGCALHLAAIQSDLDALEWKPEVCWQLPLRVEHHLDDNDHSTHFVRQWTRNDWGESGQDLGWWCSEAPEAYVGTEPVAEYLAAEVTALAGERIARQLIEYVRERAQRAHRGSPSIPVPFPARRSSGSD